MTYKLASLQCDLKNTYSTAALSNEQQFEHVIKSRDCRHEHTELSGTALGLAVAIGKRQMDFIQPSNVNLCKGYILSDAGG